MNENFIKALINQMTPDQMKGMLIELMQQPQITATSETIHNDNNEEIVALQTQIKELQQQNLELDLKNQQLSYNLNKAERSISSLEFKNRGLREKLSGYIDKGNGFKEKDAQIEGQLTLEDEVKYQSRHGQAGHDTYEEIMDSLDKADREKVRYSDSEEVFDTEEEAKNEGISFEDAWNRHHEDKIGGGSKTVNFDDDSSNNFNNTSTNEFGF